MKGHLQLAIGLIAGLLLGLVTAATQQPVLLWVTEALRPIGTVFINLLTMVVIPLVASALFVGVAQLGDTTRLGRLGIKTLLFFWSTTLIGTVIGLLAAKLILAPVTPEQQTALRAVALADSVVLRPAAEAVRSGGQFLVDLVPRNPIEAAARGALLPFIVFVTVFAAAAASLPAERRQPLIGLAEGVNQALTRVVGWVLVVAPVGIAALIAPPVARLGADLLAHMALFIVAVLAGLALLLGAVLLPLAAVLGRIPPGRFLKAILPSYAMGMSTTSSLATLPAMMDAANGDLKLPRPVSSFILPLAASLNRPGSAVYQAVAVVFMGQFYGIPLGAGEAVEVTTAVFLASLTVAGIPLGSVLSLTPAFTAVGIPLAGIGVLAGLDRIPDMFRTATNVSGHLTAATVVAASEGEHPS
jgi:Na+/H+-dicarboxylate symporter